MKINAKEGGKLLFELFFEKLENSWTGIERISAWYEAKPHVQADSHRVICKAYSDGRIIGSGTTEPQVAIFTKAGCENIIEAQRVVKYTFDCIVDSGYEGLITYRGMNLETLKKRARTYTASLRRRLYYYISNNKIPESIHIQRLLDEARIQYEAAANKILTPEDAALFAIFFRTVIDLDHIDPLYRARTDKDELIRRSGIENIQALTKSAHKEKTRADQEADKALISV